MAGDEPRRSVRATRGQHSKIDLDQAPPPPKQTKSTKKGKKPQKQQEQHDEEDEEDDGPMRCICGATTEDPNDDQPWIACDKCHAWQHNVCMGLSEWDEEQPEQYFCEECKPENHKALLAAIAKDEEPWIEYHSKYLIRKREEAEKKKREAAEKRKRGKKGKRNSDPLSRRSKGAEATPAATPEPKTESQEPKHIPRSESKPEPKMSKKEKEKAKEKESEKEQEKKMELEMEIEQQKEKEKEQEKAKQEEMAKEKEMEIEKKRQKEKEKAVEQEKQEVEKRRKRYMEMVKKRFVEEEKEKQIEKEKERERVKAREQDKEREKEKEKEKEKDRVKVEEIEKAKQMEKEKQIAKENEVRLEKVKDIEILKAKDKQKETDVEMGKEKETQKDKGGNDNVGDGMDEKEGGKEKATPKVIKGQKRPQDTEPKGPEPKLRKGPEGQPVPASPIEAQSPAILALAEDRQGPAKALTKTMTLCMKSSISPKLYGASSQTRAEKLALAVEAAVYNSHPNHNSYAQQCRTLNHNLKHNQELYDRLVGGGITPEGLSTMTSAAMQTKEQQQKDAEMLARATKQATLSDENTGPRIKRTHKGDELVGEENVVMEDAPTTIFRRPSVKKDVQVQPLQIETQYPRKGPDFDFKKVMSSVSPTSATYRRPSHPVGPGEDADVDRMLGESPPYSPVADKDPDKVWEGKVLMQSLADYFADAKWAAGLNPERETGLKWEQLIPHEMIVAGRIDSPVANTYLCSLRYSALDISVVTLSPTYPTGKDNHQAIIEYLLSKNRFAVISTRPAPNDGCKIVDMYLAACPAGSGDPFEFILNMHECILPKDRPEPILIGVLVLEPGPQATVQKTVMVGAGNIQATHYNGGAPPAGPPHEPATPNGQLPPGSQLGDLPTGEVADPTSEAQQQQQRGQRMALEVLGPELYDTPTLKFLLPMANRMSESEWYVIKSVYQTDPRAREDLGQLNAAIEKRAKERSQPSPSQAPPPTQLPSQHS